MTSEADPVVDDYIGVHLFNDLRWLLVAATTWSVCKANPERTEAWPPHLIVMAEDSVLVHARALFEKLTGPKYWEGRLQLAQWPISELWDDYSSAVNQKVMHLSPKRPYAPGVLPGDDLPDQVASLAQAALDLLDDFARCEEVEPYRPTIVATRTKAIAEAQRSAAWLGVDQIYRI